MFNGISWSTYLLVVFVVLVAWYLFVGLRFYSDELKEVLKGRKDPAIALHQPNAQREEANKTEEKEDEEVREEADLTNVVDDTYRRVQGLTEELTEGITTAVEKKYVRQEFIQYLQRTMSAYADLKDSPYRSAINELIISECDKHGAVKLNKQETDLLWTG